MEKVFENCVDPDQTPQNVVSDQVLHSLHLLLEEKADIPYIGNEPVQNVRIEEFTRL